jgi:hypothetical protein
VGNDGVGLWMQRVSFVGRYECFQMSVVWVLYRVQEGYVTLEWVSIYIYIYIYIYSLWLWLVIGQDKE